MSTETFDIWVKRLLIASIGLGVIASFVNFFNFRSLWLDEVLLSVSIVNRDYVGLLQPLEFDQVAPIGFLFIENLFSSLFGNADWSLRIYPFLCFLGSIPLIYRLNKQLFKSTLVALLSASLFCLNTFLLYYSIEVKQYMSDVFVCLLILVSALSYFNAKTKRSLLIYISVSFASVWFSNIAVIILFVVGLISLYKFVITNRLKSFEVLWPSLIALMSFVIYYGLFIHNHPAKEVMLVYWTENFGFLYQDVFSWEFRYFIRTRIEAIIQVLLEIAGYWIVTFAFVGIGVLSNFKRKTALFILLSPLCIHLGLSYFKLYPFDRRLVLYAIPLLITLLSYGIYISWRFLYDKGLKLPVFILLIPVFINLIAVFNLVPFEKEEIKKGMSYLNSNLKVGDEIYVYSVSKVSFDFYKDKFDVIQDTDAIFYSNVSRNDWSKHHQELEQLKDSVWLVFSHISSNANSKLNEKDYILKTMKSNGYQLIHTQEYEGASVYKMEK
ncbi:glycosyltransferase family 39 protein [Psychroserpens algicola]|uniref:Glycosyltransferase family 39 protein n=1 Tax=Psychroserpens algicola TaxID=1719034 RepID=A0ABT0H5C8_9FLAO|nr:glycosyltransferase family 39 protein [Psychroserpens algicola]MCK8479571.1 glycosyltransferase family 39 protein [Psychroserpens algicola]